MLEVDVWSSPGAALYPGSPMWSVDLAPLADYDEQLVKPALLYADVVNLRSDRVDMRAANDSRAWELLGMPLRRVLIYAAICVRRDPDELARLGLSADVLCPPEVAESLFSEGADPSLAFPFAVEYEHEIDAVVEAYLEVLRERRDVLHSSQLGELVKDGLVNERGWGEGHDDVWSIAWEGQFDFFDRLVAEAAASLPESRNPILLEPGTTLVLGSKTSNFKAQRPVGPAEVAMEVLSRLPVIEDLSLGQVAELRNDLSEQLIPFRAGMVDMADKVAERMVDGHLDFNSAIDREWERAVAPHLVELQRSVESGAYPSQLKRAFASDPGTLAAASSALTVVAGSPFIGLSALVPAAVLASAPFIKAWQAHRDAVDAIKHDRLMLLYRVGGQTRG